jgi:A/G-specific adenine glycosylase
VDGNVYRVLARFFGQSMPVDSTSGKKWFAQKAHEVLDTSRPGDFNQAIMDFGATVCTPARADCTNCPLNEQCIASQESLVDQYPVKKNRQKKRSRYFHFLILNFNKQVIIRKRTGKDVWKGLYDFPLVERAELTLRKDALSDLLQEVEWLPEEGISLQRLSKPFNQTLSHQQVHAVFTEWQLTQLPELPDADLMLVDRENLRNFAFPKIIDWYLNDKSLYLNL